MVSTRIWNLSSSVWTTAAVRVNPLSRANHSSNRIIHRTESFSPVKSFEPILNVILVSLKRSLRFFDASVIFHGRIIVSLLVDDVDILSSKVCPSFVLRRLFILVRNWKFRGYLPCRYCPSSLLFMLLPRDLVERKKVISRMIFLSYVFGQASRAEMEDVGIDVEHEWIRDFYESIDCF